jgi:hypothetical protein
MEADRHTTRQSRIRSNMHGTLTRKFVDLMAEYQEIQTKYKNKYRERVERQARRCPCRPLPLPAARPPAAVRATAGVPRARSSRL